MPLLTADEIYSRLHVGNPGDLEFYKRVVTGAKSVLEVGCGWGRLAGPLARCGHEVSGLDNNERFLQKARAEYPDVNFVLGDACSPSSWDFKDRRFERILVPYNTLYSLGGKDRIERMIVNAKAFLVPDGEIWLDVYPIDDLHEALSAGYVPEEDDDEPVATWNDASEFAEGGILEVRERTEFVPGEPALNVTYEVTQASQLCGTLQMRHDYLPVAQLVDLLEANGLSVTCLWGDFEGTSLGDEPEQVIIGAVFDGAV